MDNGWHKKSDSQKFKKKKMYGSPRKKRVHTAKRKKRRVSGVYVRMCWHLNVHQQTASQIIQMMEDTSRYGCKHDNESKYENNKQMKTRRGASIIFLCARTPATKTSSEGEKKN